MRQRIGRDVLSVSTLGARLLSICTRGIGCWHSAGRLLIVGDRLAGCQPDLVDGYRLGRLMSSSAILRVRVLRWMPSLAAVSDRWPSVSAERPLDEPPLELAAAVLEADAAVDHLVDAAAVEHASSHAVRGS